MKQLLVIRHAKSSWNFDTLDDFDRPLNDRGSRDAPEMVKRLKNKDIVIDLFVASPARRALDTAVIFADAYKISAAAIIKVDTLYEAQTEAFYEVVSHLPDIVKTVAIFSHNPTITNFVNGLTQVKIDHMPTCGVFGLKVAITEWQNFEVGEKEFWFFDYPKAI